MMVATTKEKSWTKRAKSLRLHLAHTLSKLVDTAKKAGLPYQMEVMSGRTGTDADVIAVSESGIPACTVSVPIKYMHTPVEAVNMSDIEDTAALIAAFCEGGAF